MFSRKHHRRQLDERYEQAVREYSADLFAFAFRLSGNRDVAEDLVQETFFHAWRGFDALRDEDRLRAWLFQILRNRYSHWCRDQALMNAMRAMQREIAASAASGGGGASAGGGDPAIRLAEREVIQQALNQLDERFRMPLLMVCIEGMSCREAAEQLDLPLGTVLSRLHRARKHLHICLESREMDEDRCPLEKSFGTPPNVRRQGHGGGA